MTNEGRSEALDSSKPTSSFLFNIMRKRAGYHIMFSEMEKRERERKKEQDKFWREQKRERKKKEQEREREKKRLEREQESSQKADIYS